MKTALNARWRTTTPFALFVREWFGKHFPGQPIGRRELTEVPDTILCFLFVGLGTKDEVHL